LQTEIGDEAEEENFGSIVADQRKEIGDETEEGERKEWKKEWKWIYSDV
jgi:hypothetical protein